MFQVPAILTGFATKVDGGASVRFATNELTDTDILQLKRQQGQFGFLLFRENAYTPKDIPTEQAEDGSKSPSKRLRAVLFVQWKQEGEKGDFEAFYVKSMNAIIEKCKGQLD